ncbi:hypothetical protein UC8_00020 [Roseimaritima ulvae]|uniref:Uncharacterized protein n=1 Tax=Roseimaritima ulvae TaxID=980254 RepID=A0A5B9QJ60_9BACT|nr:hypothetical protein UC8_00020 [Roseimaritima ulvae]
MAKIVGNALVGDLTHWEAKGCDFCQAVDKALRRGRETVGGCRNVEAFRQPFVWPASRAADAAQA